MITRPIDYENEHATRRTIAEDYEIARHEIQKSWSAEQRRLRAEIAESKTAELLAMLIVGEAEGKNNCVPYYEFAEPACVAGNPVLN